MSVPGRRAQDMVQFRSFLLDSLKMVCTVGISRLLEQKTLELQSTFEPGPTPECSWWMSIIAQMNVHQEHSGRLYDRVAYIIQLKAGRNPNSSRALRLLSRPS
jgi:hypothetical protein